MRTLLIAAYVLSMALVLMCHAVLPPEVAIHFGAGGQADGWAPKIVNSALFAGLYTLLLVFFLLAPRLTFAMPPHLINLPNKEHWLSEENRPRAMALFARLIHEFGAAVLGFFIAIGLLTLKANLSQPGRLDTRLFLTVLVLFLLYTGLWCVRLFTAYRQPPPEAGS